MSNPTVTIGLAVYNGEQFIRQAIDSILAQTFTDFELIISDNASTDSTNIICNEYAKRDHRIRYHRNQTNIGGANNENLTFQMAKGKYFRLAAHDDYLAPTLLEKCVSVLDQNQDIVLAYSEIFEIDEEGKISQTKKLNKGLSSQPSQRFHDLAFHDHQCEPTYGLIRSNVMEETRLQQNYTDSDRVFLCELSLRGRFYEINEPLFYKRYHSGNVYIDWRSSRISWFNPAWKGKIILPYWLQFINLIICIKQAPISRKEQFLCFKTLMIWLTKYGRRMIKDILVALYMVAHSREWRMRRAITNWE